MQGRREQAFPLLTVDGHGYPHVSLLSRAELFAGDEVLHVVLAGPGTRANVQRSGTATLLVIEGASAHSCKLRLVAAREVEGVLATTFELVDHKADSAGVELEPMAFVATAEVAGAEGWQRDLRVLRLLAAGD